MKQELQMLTKVETDNDWLQENYAKIQEKHEKEFVAVSDKEVIASDKNIEKVIEKVKKMGKNPAFVLIEFIPKKGLILIL